MAGWLEVSPRRPIHVLCLSVLIFSFHAPAAILEDRSRYGVALLASNPEHALHFTASFKQSSGAGDFDNTAVQAKRKEFKRQSLFLVLFGAVFGCAGVMVLYMFGRKRQIAEAMVGGEGLKSSSATITSKERVSNSEGADTFEVCYSFEAVRTDEEKGNVRYRVEAKSRSLPYDFWNKLNEGDHTPVSYFEEDPGHCRLSAAIEGDYENTHGCNFLALMAVGVVLVIGGFCFAIGLIKVESPIMNQARPSGGSAVTTAAIIWVCLVAFCFFACIMPFQDKFVMTMRSTVSQVKEVPP